MSDRDDLLTARERSARDAVRALREPAADPAFRDRLRREFASGSFAARPRAVIVRGPWRRFVGSVLLPAAAALIGVVALVLVQRPSWTVLGVEGSGLVVVDQRPIPAGHVEDLERALHPGARIRTDGALIDLAARGSMVVQVTSGTDMTLPRPPRRWLSPSVRGELRSGEVRITTGPRFRGARLVLETPEAAVEVTGTTLAVIREPAGTCVCVFDGAVAVGPKSGAMEPVAHGRRGFVFTDGHAENDVIRPEEIGALGAFRDRHRARLRRESD